MSRPIERERVANVLRVVLMAAVVVGLAGCEQIKARNQVREGNRMFRDTRFIDAAHEYEQALKVVEHPIVHYNLALAYSKVFKPGFDGPVLLGTAEEPVCNSIPGTKVIDAGACVKEGDRHFAECGASKTAPIEKQIAELSAQAKAEVDEAKKQELETQLRDRQDELGRFTCASSFRCVESKFCALTSPELADLAATHYGAWIKSQPTDEVIRAQVTEVKKQLEDAKKLDDKGKAIEIQKHVDELGAKDQTRALMTGIWIDSEQFRKAIDYWEGLLKERPNDPEIIGTLGGIQLKAGNWRESIEWYAKLAEVSPEPANKVAAYRFIGNVAWAKLNSRTLIGAEIIEIADRALAALQRGTELEPKNPRLFGLQGSIMNFRSSAHGASWAGALDRASGQDLAKTARVLLEEAKKAEEAAKKAPGTTPGTPSPTPAPTTTTPTPPPSGTGAAGSAEKSPG